MRRLNLSIPPMPIRELNVKYLRDMMQRIRVESGARHVAIMIAPLPITLQVALVVTTKRGVQRTLFYRPIISLHGDFQNDAIPTVKRFLARYEGLSKKEAYALDQGEVPPSFFEDQDS